MNTTRPHRIGRRCARPLLWVVLLGMAVPAAACELDGLSHGYGPMSALFAGAHRYQSLNGLEDEEPPPEAPPPEPAEQAKADDELRPSPGTAPPTPPRSFVAWAKAKPKVPGAGDAPASWVPRPMPRSADAPRAAPQGAEPQQREQGQRPPSGGPVP